MQEAKKSYQLYIGKLQKLNGVEFSYFSAQSGYLLAYSDNPIEGMSAVPLQNESKLADDERRWLRDCKVVVNTRAMRENTEAYTDFLNGFLDEFEKALKAEAEQKKDEKK